MLDVHQMPIGTLRFDYLNDRGGVHVVQVLRSDQRRINRNVQALFPEGVERLYGEGGDYREAISDLIGKLAAWGFTGTLVPYAKRV